MRPRRKAVEGLEITPETALSRLFAERTRAPLDAVATHEYFRLFADEAITRAQVEKGILGFYPLIEAFPRYMAITLARMDPHERPRAAEARGWLMRNIATEEKHREWWLDLGRPFGFAPEDFAAARPSAAMDVQNHFLFHVTSAGVIAEAIAANNFAVEGATGVWTKVVAAMSSATAKRLRIEVDERALRWLVAHADYDDLHPVEALEIVKIYATDEAAMERAAGSAVRSLEYYAMALDDALEA